MKILRKKISPSTYHKNIKENHVKEKKKKLKIIKTSFFSFFDDQKSLFN